MDSKIYSIQQLSKLCNQTPETVIKSILSIFPKWKQEKYIELRADILYRVFENIKKYTRLSHGKLFVIIRDLSDNNLIFSVDFMSLQEIELFKDLIKINKFSLELIIDNNNPMQYRMYYECYFYNGSVKGFKSTGKNYNPVLI